MKDETNRHSVHPSSFSLQPSSFPEWWPARVTLPVQRLKRPLHHFNACRPEIGARGRIRTCTGDALDVVSLLLDYASKEIGASSR